MKKLYIPRTNCKNEKFAKGNKDLRFQDKAELISANKGYAYFSKQGDYWVDNPKNMLREKIFDNFIPNEKIKGWYLSSPAEIGLELTRRCNQKCTYCWNESGGSTDIKDELFYSITNQFRDRGGQKIELTGGEPFQHPSLIKYLSFLNEKGVPHVGLTTNGTLINKEVAREISNYIKNIGVSLQASNEKLNGSLTKRQGFFKKTLKGIENLVENGVPVILMHTIMPENESDLELFFKLAKNINTNHIKFNFLRTLGRARSRKQYTQQKLDRLKVKVLNLSKKFGIEVDIRSLISKIPLEEDFEFYGSNSLRYSLKINYDGKCASAPFSNTFIGDLNYQSLEEIWFGEKANEIRNKMKCPNPECELRDRCGGLWQRL